MFLLFSNHFNTKWYFFSKLSYTFLILKNNDVFLVSNESLDCNFNFIWRMENSHSNEFKLQFESMDSVEVRDRWWWWAIWIKKKFIRRKGNFFFVCFVWALTWKKFKWWKIGLLRSFFFKVLKFSKFNKIMHIWTYEIDESNRFQKKNIQITVLKRIILKVILIII